ncbi:MAG TPA: hypothetical protein VJY33_06020 [Isosphaeraceae bacterium]|nr:hypothetical protein [Isosphaeraceae bacterium]
MIGPISVSPETIESKAHSIRAGGGDHVRSDEPTALETAVPDDQRRRRESSTLTGAIPAPGRNPAAAARSIIRLASGPCRSAQEAIQPQGVARDSSTP